jgi:hypothetical protein
MPPKGSRKAKAKAKALEVGHKKADLALPILPDGATPGAEAAAGPEEHNIVRHGGREYHYVIGFIV